MSNSLLLSGQQPKTIEVTGKIKGSYTGKIFLFFEDNYRQRDSISSVIKDGNFQFRCNVSTPILGHIHLDQTSLVGDFYIDQARTYLACTNEMKITNAGKDTFNILTIDTIKGSHTEEIKSQFFRALGINSISGINNTDTVVYADKLLTLVRKNAKSKLAPYLISQSSHLSYARLYALAKKVDVSLNNTFEMKNVTTLIQWKQKQSLGLLNEGMPFHDISLPDLNDRQINTKELTGNYFLVICWGSWCAPCRKENPALRSIYNKYKDKGLTMVGISFDQSKLKWAEAVEKDQLPWTQLIDLKRFNGELATYYGIVSIPMQFLLDKNRKIIATGSLDEIMKKLDTVIQ